ncbi:hypothetical protein [Speluncibacter jeojiensis]|uniref:Uncharacterized protein n=1 Tax=Speluncibacter jeojiensis TaxID=2710754 RepID=A0A9X4LWF8_9ACTN|nr:hypothetical protein [Corynebacteriales bacterium D3-21]
MNGDPHSAPARPDLTFLRRRTRPGPQPTPQAAPVSTPPVDYTRRSAPQSGADLDLSAPSSPDLSGPPSLGLSGDEPAAQVLDLSLDLSATEDVPSPGPAIDSPRVERPPRRVRAWRRLAAGDRLVLSAQHPTVALTRIQSGVGALTIRSLCPESAADLRFGCAYTVRSGKSSTVSPTTGRTAGPTGAHSPIITGVDDGRGGFDIDLRQCRDLDRLVIYGFTRSGAPTAWPGTITVATAGGGRIELALNDLPETAGCVVLSLFNVHGQFVLRSEMCPINGTVRDACLAFGFDDIGWIDGYTPLD